MRNPGNIFESVSVISEEELLVQELDRRLSFDVFANAWPCPEKEHCPSFLCDCITKSWCDCKTDVHVPPTCGVRG